MLFISPLKLFLFSRYLNFCLEFSVMSENSLIRKIRLILKLMTSQLGKEAILQYTYCKGNQAMKFGQLIEYNLRNIFLQKSYAKCCKVLFPDLLLKN